MTARSSSASSRPPTCSATRSCRRACSTTPPEINQGEREVAILVDAATGVAGKIEPGRQVDVIASYGAEDGDAATGKKPKPNRSIVIVPGARVIAVGAPRAKAAKNAEDAQQDPGHRGPGHVRARQGAGAAGRARPGVRRRRPARAAAPRRPLRAHARRDDLQGRRTPRRATRASPDERPPADRRRRRRDRPPRRRAGPRGGVRGRRHGDRPRRAAARAAAARRRRRAALRRARRDAGARPRARAVVRRSPRSG